MVSIYHTANGWAFAVQAENAYYSSLVEVMDAAYAAENRKANNPPLSSVRNSPCHNCRFAAGG